MMSIALDDTFIITSNGRAVTLEALELGFQVRALVQLGHNPDVAKVFGYSGAERGKVIALAVREGLITL